MKPWEPVTLSRGKKGRGRERRAEKGRREEGKGGGGGPKGKFWRISKCKRLEEEKKRLKVGQKWLGAVSHESRTESFIKKEVKIISYV